MPKFPITKNNKVERYHKEFKQKRQVSIESQSASEEDKVESSGMVEDATSDDSLKNAPGVMLPQSTIGDVSVKFMQKDMYSKSGVLERRLLTETWAPGKKWWTSARLGDVSQRKFGLYILDDSTVTSSK